MVAKLALATFGIFVLIFSMFAALVYDTKQDYKNFVVQVDNLKQANILLVKENQQLKSKTKELKNKLAIIEESIDPKNFRWAKIKKVREAVQQTPGAVDRLGSTLAVTKYASAVVEYSEEYDVSIPLVLAMTRKESAFNPRATSYKKNGAPLAKGIIQIIDSTAHEIAADIGVRHYNMYNIKDNVRFGVYYIMKMLDEFDGSVDLAVRAYNCGPTCVKMVEAGRFPDFPLETRNYVKTILGDREVEGFIKFYENMGL